jgi:hypothetical protein
MTAATRGDSDDSALLFHSVDDIREEVILRELHRAGITTLDEFARAYEAAVSASVVCDPMSAAHFRAPVAAPAAVPRRNPPRAGVLPIKHRPRTIPLVIDGDTFGPDEDRAHENTPVHLVVDAEAENRGTVTGFTDLARVDQHVVSERPATAAATSSLTAGDVSNETGYCYEHINFAGSVLRIPRMNEWWNFSMPDLTQVYRSCFLWWCSGPWNDIISSVRAENYSIRFYEHVYFQGSSLTVSYWSAYSNLVALGWNDRISSFQLLV